MTSQTNSMFSGATHHGKTAQASCLNPSSLVPSEIESALGSALQNAMATANPYVGERRKHVIIFSRKCLFLDSPGAQEILNSEVAKLVSNPDFELYFTSHRCPAPEMIEAIPDA